VTRHGEISNKKESYMRSTTRSFQIFFLSISLLALLTGNAFAKSPSCSEVGGALLTNVGGFGQIDGHLTTLGVATGDLKGALGVEILAVNSTSTMFTVQHHWVTDNGDTLTIGQAQAKGMFVASGLLAITEYNFQVSGGTGRFTTASGNLSAIGELDFNTGHAILRYSGELCYSVPDKREGTD
jgi:hypothetical protein